MSMPLRVVEFEETPNPNALKCVLDRTLSTERQSYFSREEAEGDLLARCLFGIEGVRHVMIMQDWITVGKAPEASWRSLKASIKRTLAEVPER